jgi:hypothetical protein
VGGLEIFTMLGMAAVEESNNAKAAIRALLPYKNSVTLSISSWILVLDDSSKDDGSKVAR